MATRRSKPKAPPRAVLSDADQERLRSDWQVFRNRVFNLPEAERRTEYAQFVAQHSAWLGVSAAAVEDCDRVYLHEAKDDA